MQVRALSIAGCDHVTDDALLGLTLLELLDIRCWPHQVHWPHMPPPGRNLSSLPTLKTVWLSEYTEPALLGAVRALIPSVKAFRDKSECNECHQCQTEPRAGLNE